MASDKTDGVLRYYHSFGSRLGYRFLLGGTRHFGYYPEGQSDLSIRAAQQNMTDHLGQTLALPQNALVLDAGCGEGSVSRRLSEHFGYRVEGIDLLDISIKRATRAAESQKNLHYQIADYHQLPFEDESFDGVFTLETLVHAHDYEQVLREFYRVLKPGGRVVFFEYTIPELSIVSARERRMYEAIISGSSMTALPQFVHGRFPEILEKAGFESTKVDDITARTLPMLKRFVRWARGPYLIVQALNLQRQNPNITAAIEFDRYRDFKFVAVSANKPQRR